MTDKGYYAHMSVDREKLRQVLGVDRPRRMELPEAETEGWLDYWRRESLRKYPTPDAYEAVCRARDSWQARAEREIKRRDELGELLQKAENELAEQSRQWLLEKGLRQQAEQERDDVKEYFRIKQDQVWALDKERTHLREANTAMRKALLAERADALTWDGIRTVKRIDEALKHADDLLSRYPKEGGQVE